MKLVYILYSNIHKAVKIGYSENIITRFGSFETGNLEQLELLMTLNGDMTLERDLHYKFENYKIKNEWFRFTPELLDSLYEIQKQIIKSLTTGNSVVSETAKNSVIHKTMFNTNSLALYFTENPVILNGFDVTKDYEKDNWIVTYNGKSDRITLDEAFNVLIKKLLPVFSNPSWSINVVSNAILKAHHWSKSEKGLQSTTFDDAIIEIASSFTKRFTIPDIKKKLPSLRMPSKEIESFLLSNGWSIITYGSCRVKYFSKVDE